MSGTSSAPSDSPPIDSAAARQINLRASPRLHAQDAHEQKTTNSGFNTYGKCVLHRLAAAS